MESLLLHAFVPQDLSCACSTQLPSQRIQEGICSHIMSTYIASQFKTKLGDNFEEVLTLKLEVIQSQCSCFCCLRKVICGVWPMAAQSYAMWSSCSFSRVSYTDSWNEGARHHETNNLKMTMMSSETDTFMRLTYQK